MSPNQRTSVPHNESFQGRTVYVDNGYDSCDIRCNNGIPYWHTQFPSPESAVDRFLDYPTSDDLAIHLAEEFDGRGKQEAWGMVERR
jgi:hypothetical protein